MSLAMITLSNKPMLMHSIKYIRFRYARPVAYIMLLVKVVQAQSGACT